MGSLPKGLAQYLAKKRGTMNPSLSSSDPKFYEPKMKSEKKESGKETMSPKAMMIKGKAMIAKGEKMMKQAEMMMK